MTETTAVINATNLGCSITCKNLEASIRFYRDEPADRAWGVRMFQFKDLDGIKLGVSTPLAG